MSLFRFQITTKTTSAIDRDFAVNTMWADLESSGAMQTALDAFEDWHVTATDLASSSYVQATNGGEIKAYDMADIPPRAIQGFREYNLTPSTGRVMPTQVSMCMSFAATRVSGVSAANQRGRVYVPFPRVSDNETDGRPNAALIDNIVAAGDALLDASNAANGFVWVVYSPTAGQFWPVSRGWVDNSWDIQRRRQRDPTGRTEFP